MSEIPFTAWEYRADGSFAPARYVFAAAGGRWRVLREGEAWLELGPGYRPLRSLACGVCATDLARRFLPFPLPQVIGHEVLAADETGARCVVEINASHAARGVRAPCPFCAARLGRHCPERLVLGIDRLPGGFGPWILAPAGAVHAVPPVLPDRTALLVEPFAAALHGVRRLTLRGGEKVGVLGPRRLGLLVVAALAAERRRTGRAYEITALHRRPGPLALARALGADRTVRVDVSPPPTGSLDVVVDTTGTPAGLELALTLARREVHLKSTHGRPAAGLTQLTAMVVDELALAPFPADPEAFARVATDGGLPAPPTVAWLVEVSPPRWLAETGRVLTGEAAAILRRLEEGAVPPGGLPRADLAVVESAAQVDGVIRPTPGREVSLLRPGGLILFHPAGRAAGPLLGAVAGRGLRLTTSRCGDFAAALELLAGDPTLRALGERLVTHTFPPAELPAALAAAASPACTKAVVLHGEEA